MGQKPKTNEINFDDPIPRALHDKVKMLAVTNRMAVKDIVIYALTDYVNRMNSQPADFDDDDL